MFKFIVQAPNLDEAVVKLKELTVRLEGKGVKAKKEVKTFEEEEVALEDEFTPENMIGQTLDKVEDVSPALDMSGELDAEGLPWDARIHSSGKSKYKKDNTWTLKRGVSDEEAARVKGEYRNILAQATPMASPEVVLAPLSQPVSAPVVQQAPPALPTMTSGHTVETFKANFPLILGGLITEGKVTQDYINQLKAYFKVDEIWMLNDEQKANLFESFVGYKLITKVG